MKKSKPQSKATDKKPISLDNPLMQDLLARAFEDKKENQAKKK